MIRNTTKQRNPNRKFTRLVRNGEAQIRQFAEQYRLPIVEIDGLVRPVLGSGLWNPIFYLIGVDEDEDFDLDESVGFGHLVGPLEKPTAIAAEWLASLDWNKESGREWTHTNYLKESLTCRTGAVILAADLLGIPIRHFDFCMMSVELLIPSTTSQPKRKRNRSPSIY